MVTINIKENSKQAKLFLEFAKSLSFVEFVDTGLSKPATVKKSRTKDKVPNEVTLRSMAKTDKGIGLTKTSSHEDLMDKLFS
jgi:hypothetical protein